MHGIYTRAMPSGIRRQVRRFRKRISKLMGTDTGGLPRRRQGPTISVYERGGRPAPKAMPAEIATVLEGVKQFPEWWHQSGSLPYETIAAMAQHVLDLPFPVTHSLETGCGVSTLLLSNLSPDHKVFTLGNVKDSLPKTLQSPLLRRSSIEIIDGPSQLTLPVHKFETKFQVALLDGPHHYPSPDLEYYYVYPHLDTGALLIIDDIQIPSIFNLFEFIASDAMFELLDVVRTTAFFRRTAAPTFDRVTGSWVDQGYNASEARKYR